MVYTERAESAAVSRGTAHVTTKHFGGYSETHYKKKEPTVTHLESHATKAQ